MTGFGRGSASEGERIVTVEMKALNSKQLDILVKMPSRYRCLEGWLRNYMASTALRGKVEAVVSIELATQDLCSSFNTDVIRKYKEEIEKLSVELEIPTPDDWYGVLLRLPDALKSEDNKLSEEEEQAFEKATREAMEDMFRFRKDEGLKLEKFFIEKIENIRNLLSTIQPFEEGRTAKIRTRLLDQLEKLSGVDIDMGRLEQELIYYIEKFDITEEKQRLSSHLDYFIQTLEKTGGEVTKGKKLGFIAQEMGREINTLGSKSNNADMQIIVVKMKDELEQIKEQVLNVL